MGLLLHGETIFLLLDSSIAPSLDDFDSLNNFIFSF